MTSEEWAQKFHTDDASPHPDLGRDLSSVWNFSSSSSNVSSHTNQWSHHDRSIVFSEQKKYDLCHGRSGNDVALYLTIIPWAWMGSESIAHEAKGWISYWLRGLEGERNNCFSKIQLFGKKYWDKTTLGSKTRFSRHCFGFQCRRFLLLVGYNI